MLTLVDAITKEEVREAYFDGKTIVGSRKAPVDGNPAQWNQPLARAQWELDLAPNALIHYQGYTGGTFWRRTIESQTATRHQKIKKTTQYIEVPDYAGRLFFPDLVVLEDALLPAPEKVYTLVQGDDWTDTIVEEFDLTDYTYEIELRRSPNSAVAATVEFDYTLAGENPYTVIMKLPSEVTASLRGKYIARVQRFDPQGDRTTLAYWLFVVGQDA